MSTEKQRLDSTHIISNMANLSRLQLFVRTIEEFLKQLQKKNPGLYKKLPSLYDKVYLKRFETDVALTCFLQAMNEFGFMKKGEEGAS